MAKKQKRNKKWISWLIILILFIAAAVVAYLVWDNYFRDKDDNRQREETPTSVVENKPVETTETTEITEKPKVVQYDGDDPNTAEQLSGAITHAEVSGESLMIRVNIDQYLEEGECELKLLDSSGTIIYSDLTVIMGNVATSTCEGFDVPVSEIGSGITEIRVGLSAGEKSGEIRGEVDI
ncbi:MAG: hypothetical protein Q4A70_00305 [Candidatus Saccharibacteria bacterium]|nr:hypothetical protein [Candidatus Saccharibacteria bacterium]